MSLCFPDHCSAAKRILTLSDSNSEDRILTSKSLYKFHAFLLILNIRVAFRLSIVNDQKHSNQNGQSVARKILFRANENSQ